MPPTQSESSIGGLGSNPVLSLPHSSHLPSSPLAMPSLDDKPSSSSSSDNMPISSQVAPNESPKKRETVIIFDWDDTLLASSFLSGRGYRLDTEMTCTEIDQQLKELEASVISCLQMALQYGEVHVITNAETGWVQLSAQKFIPSVVPFLGRVKVISARSTYEQMFPDSPLKWKYYAMHEKLSGLFAQPHVEKNIISFGDSHVEREAVRAVTRGSVSTLTKSVKFAERPSMEQLRRQIELVTNCFAYIHNHQGDLDLQLTVTVNNPNEASNNAAPSSPVASSPSVVPPASSSSSSGVVSPASCMFPANAMSDEMDVVEEQKPISC